jgi:16S rRNA (cytosine967-C5)-methyltransferase
VAHVVVRRVFEEDAYADRAFRGAAEKLDARDRAFAMQIAYGTVQRVRTLDHAIETLGRRPVRKLDPPVRAALRIGAYQLAYMDGVPAHAAVDESVELVRRAGLERAVAFTNAVLRRLSDGLPEVLERLHEETPTAAALMHSYPDWVAETWWRELGAEDARALMRRQNEPPETAVRTPEGPKVVDSIPPDWLESGYAWPQSRGSQLAGAAVGARPGERVLDLCAAPGGKATQLAAAGAEVVAVERHAGRARELEENARRL